VTATPVRDFRFLFGEVAQDYDRYRPAPPPQAVDWALEGDCRSVLDLGAGTGVLTRTLLRDRPELKRVVAVEPDPRMREVLERTCPGAEVLDGTGERIPLPADSIDVALISAAWHFMDPAAACAELARVLTVDTGVLCVLYIRRDQADELLKDIDAHIRQIPWLRNLPPASPPLSYQCSVTPDQAMARERPEQEADLPPDAPFRLLGTNSGRSTLSMTPREVVGLYSTYGGVISLPSDLRSKLIDDLLAYVAAHPRFAAGGTTEIGMVWSAWKAQRRPHSTA
jgi:ubiquinone/menaquinone biosynthesis C-methylase UbiE